MVMLGAFAGLTRAVGLESLVESLKKVLPEHRLSTLPLNVIALKEGFAWSASAKGAFFA